MHDPPQMIRKGLCFLSQKYFHFPILAMCLDVRSWVLSFLLCSLARVAYFSAYQWQRIACWGLRLLKDEGWDDHSGKLSQRRGSIQLDASSSSRNETWNSYLFVPVILEASSRRSVSLCILDFQLLTVQMKTNWPCSLYNPSKSEFYLKNCSIANA